MSEYISHISSFPFSNFFLSLSFPESLGKENYSKYFPPNSVPTHKEIFYLSRKVVIVCLCCMQEGCHEQDRKDPCLQQNITSFIPSL